MTRMIVSLDGFRVPTRLTVDMGAVRGRRVAPDLSRLAVANRACGAMNHLKPIPGYRGAGRGGLSRSA